MSADSEFGLFGAYERHNLGDLLMPWCFERLLEDQAGPWLTMEGTDFYLESSVRSEEIKTWQNQGGRSVLHVGGDVLACDWVRAQSFVSEKYQNSDSRPFPYLLPQEEQGRSWENRFLYGAGGTSLESMTVEMQEKLKNTLSGMQIVVRDNQTQETLRELEVESRVAPCVVTLYSDLIEHSAASDDKPIVFQISEVKAEELGDSLPRNLNRLSEKMGGRRVLIVLAGLASGHDSLASAALLRQQLLKQGCPAEILLTNNPHAVVSAVADAGLLISSSLHLQILAISYAVPRASFQISKIERYAHTWDPNALIINNEKDFVDESLLALESSTSDLEATASSNRKTAIEEISRLFEIADVDKKIQRSGNKSEETDSKSIRFLLSELDGALDEVATALDVEKSRTIEFAGQRDHYDGLKNLAERKQKEAERKQKEAERKQKETEELATEFKGQRDHYAGLAEREKNRVEALLQSTSWKVTEPFRQIAKRISRLKAYFEK